MTMATTAGPAPGTITAARVIGWIQVGLTALGAGIVLIGAVVFTGAANDDDAGEFSGLLGVVAGFLVVLILLLLVILAAIMVPLIMLRPGRPGAGTALVVVESILVVIQVVSLANDGSPGVASVIVLLSGVAMIVLLSVAPSRTWLRTGAPAFGAGPYPYPGMTGYPQNPGTWGAGPGQWGASGQWGAPAGRWAADPSGRHQQRYYDGAAWTAWVSDHGTTGQDPL